MCTIFAWNLALTVTVLYICHIRSESGFDCLVCLASTVLYEKSLANLRPKKKTSTETHPIITACSRDSGSGSEGHLTVEDSGVRVDVRALADDFD